MKILKLALLITFLFSSTAYPSDNLRVPMIGDKANNKDRLESAEKLASGQTISSESSDEAYAKIANWIAVKLRLSDLDEIARQLKKGELVFTGSYNFLDIDMSSDTNGTTDLKLDIRHAILLKRLKGDYHDPTSWDYGRRGYIDAIFVDQIQLPQYILSALEILKININQISEDGRKIVEGYAVGYNKDLFDSRIDIWKFKFPSFNTDARTTEYYIGRFLRSLAKNVNTPKITIIKKLQKLQQRMPETAEIIRKKALELLELDEANFRKTLKPFIGDYIAIRDAIRTAGIVDDTAEFYRLFDGIVDNISKVIIQPDLEIFKDIDINGQEDFFINLYNSNNRAGVALSRIITLLNTEHVKQMVSYMKTYGGFRLFYKPYIRDYLTKEDEDMISGYPTHNIEGHKGQKEEILILPPDSTGTKLASGQNIGNNPTANLSVLKLTPTLFLDTEVAANPDAFKQGLAQLKSNEGNIPVVLLTEETKESIMAKLKGIDLTGVQFRTKTELGLQDLDWGKDERVSLIEGIDNLKCIPLTSALCETYKDLQKARDQV